MNAIITYSLKNSRTTSNKYYDEISIFSQEVSQHIMCTYAKILKDFNEFIKKNNIEVPRSLREYSIEFLMLSTYWQIYKTEIPNVKKELINLLQSITALRNKNQIYKKISDYFKGWLITYILSENSKDKISSSKLEEVNKWDKLKQLEDVIKWMDASGEYKQELRQLRTWIMFLKQYPKEEQEYFFYQINELGKWFEDISIMKIGKYTQHVEQYINNSFRKHNWKEDIFFCSKKRLEYHLNMVGAEMMNQAFHNDFLKQKYLLIFVPRCMCAKPKKSCRAVPSNQGEVCQHCSNNCLIHQLSKLGEVNGFKVFIISHESELTYKELNERDDYGIIGIACVLNLLSGGFKSKEMGFVPQCVLLDYCGCKKHWHPKGIITTINLSKFNQIIYEFNSNK